jgi:hypothetical protein
VKYSIGVTPIVNKLPHNLQEKWTYTAVKYSIGVTPIVNKLSHNLQEKWTYTAVKYSIGCSVHFIQNLPFIHYFWLLAVPYFSERRISNIVIIHVLHSCVSPFLL